jgi:hypothetical protein
LTGTLLATENDVKQHIVSTDIAGNRQR